MSRKRRSQTAVTEPVTLEEVFALGVDGRTKRSTDAKRAFASYLAAHQTPAERMMARVLYHLGIEVAPQVLVRGYIVDFCDEANRVVFEVDGGIHVDQVEADRARDEHLAAAGYRVFRITNEGVVNLMGNVAATVGQP